MSLVHRLTNPIVWAFPGNAARKLRGFAEVEAESVLEMRGAAALTKDPARRLLYLRHALDEERHARAFLHAAQEHGAPWTPLHASSQDLFAQLGEERFLAFVHRGERRGRMQFESYEAHFDVRRPKLATLFRGIIVDERRHETYSRELLERVAGTRSRAALRWAATWEAWRRWLGAGRVVSGWIYTALMVVLYVCLAPLAVVWRLVSPARAGWIPARAKGGA
jgi:rubrerythrin